MRTLFLTLITCLFVLPAYGKYSGGTGDPNDPYQITTAEDLMLLGESPNDYDKHFILTADINLDPNLPGRKVFDRAVIASDINDVELGYQGTYFTGVFDGNAHVISSLHIQGSMYLGLFGRLGATGSISNLGMEAVEISGTGSIVGGIVGYNAGRIEECHSRGGVSGNHDVGGLVGYNSGGLIVASYSSGSVVGDGDVGGLVGNIYYGSIASSYSSATVSGTGWFVGGLVGSLSYGNITASYSSATVNGTGWFVGGLVGNFSSSKISSSYSSGSVSGTYEVGGLVGEIYSGSIATSYSSATVSGTTIVGGLIGSSRPFCVNACVWDTEISGLSGSAGGVGLTTVEMMDPDMLGLNGFANDPNWILDGGHDYPILVWQSTTGSGIPEPDIDWMDGQGTAEAPYRIDTADQLILLGKASILWNRHFVLGADIDLDPVLPGRSIFGQAVIPVFTGVFGGGGHIISNLMIEGGSYLGLFGCLGDAAHVYNLGLEAVGISGTEYVGALVGYNDGGRIATSYSSGSVSGTGYIGGLVGSSVNAYDGSITASYSSGSVSGSNFVGGLVGSNGGGSIVLSHSSGSVSGKDCVGGLVGSNSSNFGRIATSYSSGSVSGTENVGGLIGYNNPYGGSISSSFWDIQSSGQTTSAGGTGLTTAQMQDIETFLSAGWDMFDEILNGTCDHWEISPGSYPRLRYPLMPEGLGTAEQPYLIRDAKDLGTVWFEPLAHYRLAESVDLSGITWSVAVIPWFGGSFDGDGYVISNLHINGIEHVGLFGELGSTASVSNLGMEAVEISGTGSIVGGIVGYNAGRIEECHSRGGVSGNHDVGGLVGYSGGLIVASYSSGSVVGDGDVGGLVGYNFGGIATSYSSGSVSGTENVGGLVGRNYRGSIATSSSGGLVCGTSDVGGLVGLNAGSLTQCYCTGAVNGSSGVGGLVGVNGVLVVGSRISSFGVITDCYARGVVNGDDSVGIGGLVGINSYGDATGCFWDIQTSGQTASASGTGKTTAEMQTTSTFLDAGWDFVDETENGTEDIWWILEGQDYPRLWWETK